MFLSLNLRRYVWTLRLCFLYHAWSCWNWYVMIAEITLRCLERQTLSLEALPGLKHQGIIWWIQKGTAATLESCCCFTPCGIEHGIVSAKGHGVCSLVEAPSILEKTGHLDIWWINPFGLSKLAAVTPQRIVRMYYDLCDHQPLCCLLGRGLYHTGMYCQWQYCKKWCLIAHSDSCLS